MKKLQRLKETFMRTFIEMRMGTGNFFKRVDKIVDEETSKFKEGRK